MAGSFIAAVSLVLVRRRKALLLSFENCPQFAAEFCGCVVGGMFDTKDPYYMESHCSSRERTRFAWDERRGEWSVGFAYAKSHDKPMKVHPTCRRKGNLAPSRPALQD